ncbi:hypothetical protein VFPPC_15918 [Pochonia chlamydosporia 170]|uniref:Uncharacterized protein n=1 Tax=Pochonia chlamydosporia 170 TaxID=1380566 RepID=A0A179FUR7_METCM|nr:hypothetical protein VFPPC_15918 [Pochonia chlamydosporia 170]OAQ69117.1 hypothetical protein VFPPC_15918 [Pochonia chlamydosporia 170]
MLNTSIFILFHVPVFSFGSGNCHKESCTAPFFIPSHSSPSFGDLRHTLHVTLMLTNNVVC